MLLYSLTFMEHLLSRTRCTICLSRRPFTLRRYTQSADIWAFGIIMLELATGQVPRHGMGFRALVMDTVHGDTPCLGSLNTKHTYSKASSKCI